MASINKAIIVGNIGKDPESRFLPDGTAVCNITVATTEKWIDKGTGERKEAVEWHRVSMFGKTAEIADKFLSKGSSVYIEGKLQTRKWQGKDGQDHYTTEIRADTMQMLNSPGGRPDATKPQAGSGAQQPHGTTRTPDPKTGSSFDDLDSDIPF